MLRSLKWGAALAIGLTLGGAGAFASDPTPRPVYNWSGLYVGGHVGWGTADIGRQLQAEDGIPVIPAPLAYGIDTDGWFGGGQIGAQTQVGNIVLGVEGSFSKADMDGRSGADFFSPLYADCVLAGFSCESNAQIRSLATFVGRLGYATPQWMLYAKAGLAAAEVNVEWHARLNGAERTVWMSERWHAGWTAGLGFEYKIMPRMTLGLEYAFTDLESRNHSTRYTTFGVVNNILTDRVSPDDLHTVTLRLNYFLTGP